jgi:AraC family transcriptional regulator, regulatory protein of adaptative response / methylated-DNA-[protein]-cysteine methyltransferase
VALGFVGAMCFRQEAKMTPDLISEIDLPARDYAIVAQLIETISTDYRRQPSLEDLAKMVAMEPTQLQKLFTRWAGLSPKGFLQAVTLDHARRLLDDGASLLDTAYEVGMSGPGRLHDLFVTHESMSPGESKSKGAGLAITYGFHASPFGRSLIMATPRGLCGVSFSDGDDEATLKDMTRRWPLAVFKRDESATIHFAHQVFDLSQWSSDQPLRLVMIGTDFQVRVWQALLKVPTGRTVRYGELAQNIGSPKAARAVGAAVGANPISFIIPCHRAIGANGALTGYHWGLTRKRAMLGWEAGQSI